MKSFCLLKEVRYCDFVLIWMNIFQNMSLHTEYEGFQVEIVVWQLGIKKDEGEANSGWVKKPLNISRNLHKIHILNLVDPSFVHPQVFK